MPDKPLNLRDLRRAVLRYGGWEDASRGKGSHTMFFRKRGTGVFSFPLPTKDKIVKKHYVKALREQLGLTAADGISDDDFYDE
ncbi:MAG TPA: type II toxin-antitoxin system HicA family toxin [Humisphaera sp.]|nr:type II toxin-antitoxin system HicA family toxin [Humisphaera sp.]